MSPRPMEYRNARRQKSKAEAEVGRYPCRNRRILFIVVLILSVSPKLT